MGRDSGISNIEQGMSNLEVQLRALVARSTTLRACFVAMTQLRKTKPIRRALPGNPKHEALNPKQGNLKNKANLRKGLIDASSVIAGHYENIPAVGGNENKANQSQFGSFIKALHGTS